ncbi:unnamed protein product, partial [Heterosigma akashiwo]
RWCCVSCWTPTTACSCPTRRPRPSGSTRTAWRRRWSSSWWARCWAWPSTTRSSWTCTSPRWSTRSSRACGPTLEDLKEAQPELGRTGAADLPGGGGGGPGVHLRALLRGVRRAAHARAEARGRGPGCDGREPGGVRAAVRGLRAHGGGGGAVRRVPPGLPQGLRRRRPGPLQPRGRGAAALR